MQNLQDRVDELKQKQIQLKQTIHEKNTANILLGMFCKEKGESGDVDPRVEDLLKRSAEDIPDASKIPELPALILPGQHSGKKKMGTSSSAAEEMAMAQHEAILALPVAGNPNDGIDYELLGKDRSKCTPAELDKIRRERNRMHAKRTRDRKRIFMEEMEVMIKQLEGENQVLQSHLNSLDGTSSVAVKALALPIVSPCIGPTTSPSTPPPVDHSNATTAPPQTNPTTSQTALTNVPQPTTTAPEANEHDNSNPQTTNVDQIKSLLAAAGTFDKPSPCAGMLTISSVATALSNQCQSGHVSLSGEEDNEGYAPSPCKRPRLEGPTPVPTSITTGSTAAC